MKKHLKTASIIILIISVFVVNRINILNDIKLSIDIKTSTPDIFQVFYNTGKGYNQKESVTFHQKESEAEYYRISFLLPADSRSIRIDPGTQKGMIQIKKIRIGYHTMTGKDLIGNFKPLHHIINFGLTKNNVLSFFVTGNDPYFAYKGNVGEIIQFERFVFKIIAYVILFVSFIFLVFCLPLIAPFFLKYQGNFFIKKLIGNKLIISLTGLILLIVIINYSFTAVNSFFLVKKFSNPELSLNFNTYSYFLYDTFKRDLIKHSAPKVSKDSELKSFFITLNKSDIQLLNSDLPKSGKNQYVPAYLKISDSPKIKKVKLRYRGDSFPHWLYPKKSLRIKLGKKDLYNMERKINLVNPPARAMGMKDCVNYELSRESGLISPDYYPVRVFINNKFMGVYLYLSQADESLLRKFKRMPGSIYVGDFNAPADKNGVSELWKKSLYWEKTASRNSEQESYRDDIDKFIDSINNLNGLDFFDFADNYLDKEQFYTFFALDVLFGSEHHDFHHNHKIYFDPYKGQFEPVQWDVKTWSDVKVKDPSFYPLLKRIKLNPLLESERDKAAFNILTKMSVEKIIKRFNHYKDLTLPDLKSDIYRDKLVGIPKIGSAASVPFTIREFNKTIDDFKNILKRRREYLEALYDSSSVKYFTRANGKYQQLLFQVNGNSGIQINFKDIITDFDESSIKIFRDLNFNGTIDKSDFMIKKNYSEVMLPGRKEIEGNALNSELTLFFGRTQLIEAPIYYSYIVEGDANINVQNAIVKNVVTGKKVSVDYEQFEVRNESDSIHPWAFIEKIEKSEVISGLVHVKKSLIFEKQTNVKILPGTTFIMYPGQSIFFLGKVVAKGTEQMPVRFISNGSGKQWGTIAVQGAAASGSRFEFCEFSGGSIGEYNLIQYTAPFNIHDLKDFEIKNCNIGENFIGDDGMHIAYASGVVENCIFKNSRMDALDIDIAQVKVKDCVFINSGNDALDLMTSNVEVENNIFINSGDKGISVGEWSEGTFSNNFFYNCLIGIEVKDKSEIDLSNTLIINSREKALNLFNKNRRYGKGGKIRSDLIHILGDNKTVAADKKSEIQIGKIKNSLPPFSDFNFLSNYFKGLDSWDNLNKAIEMDSLN